MRPRSVAMWLCGAAAVMSGCGGGDGRTLMVLAASSLTEVFAEIEAEFEAEHPDVDVVVSYGGSSSLAAQIEAGAAADVFAAADAVTMARLEASGWTAAAPAVFAHNALTIAVEPGNPLRIADLDDLARDDVVVVLAAPEVPAGAYAATLLSDAGVTVDVKSFEQNVRAVASKVALGEADAGIVYRTDVAALAGRIEQVPVESDIVAIYEIAPVSPDPRASEFVEFVAGARGRTALAEAGFELP